VQDVYALRHKVFVEGRSERQTAREMGIARDATSRRRCRCWSGCGPRLEQLLEEWS